MTHLCPCPSCNRHVAVNEVACPFCKAELPESFRCQPTPPPARGRLGRAALFAAGAALAGAAACSGVQTEPLYGAPIPPDGSSQADAGTDADADIPQPEYGAPFAPSNTPKAGPTEPR